MPFVQVAGVQVNFPFEPYACQLDYMDRVIKCLREGYNGILESPTGTGKTLCLLCATLAWLEDKKAQIHSQKWKFAQAEPGTGALGIFKEQLAQQLDQAAGEWAGEFASPKIIYASRTHSQLAQVVQELKKTAYAHFKVCVLGSREQLCIHPSVMREESNTTKVHLCRAKVTARDCYFYNSIDSGKANFQNKVMDIEDLVRLGEKHKCCPYYMARELKAEADIIFMPYNYLLDPKSRKAHGVELQGNIIIFDEAHNLERICEDSSSFDLASGDIAAAIRDIDELSQKLQDLYGNQAQGFDLSGTEGGAAQDFTLEEVLRLKAQVLHLEEEIDKIPLPRREEGLTKPGNFIFEIFEKVNLSFDTKAMVIDLVDKIVSFLANESSSSVFSSKGAGLSKFSDVMKIVFSRQPDERSNLTSHQLAVSKHYKVHIREETKNKGFNSKKSDGWAAAPSTAGQKIIRTLSYWCFSPGHAMEDLKAHGVKSIILTSGTLSPIGSFKAEMGIDFMIELENPHVIEKHQVWVGVLGKGPDGVKLSSAYSNRFKDEYKASLGNAVVNFSRIVPNGLLVFFPSYPVMEQCLTNWQNGNVWNRVEQYKPIYIEPRAKVEFNTAMSNFYEKINDPTANGAIFAAVCRGKVSEGLDFSDINGRAVVITGLPFPPRMDPKIMLKMQFLDEARRQGGQGLTGQDWYCQQASRAVNQAIGRVIRHRHDYGAIILCDERFSQRTSIAQLPSWIRPYVNKYTNFGSAVRDMMTFFKTAQQTLPQPQVRSKTIPRSSGCQGAYFQPAPSRHVTSNHGNFEKSSTVTTHVPSLKPKRGHNETSEISMAKIRAEYEEAGPSQAPQRTLSATRHGLMTALLSHDKPSCTDAKHTQMPSFQTELKDSQQSKLYAKKKIMIKKPINSSVNKDTLQSAEQYVIEVKKTLSAESYKFFSKTLGSYKETGQYLAMVESLADIFTEHKQNYHLFRKFYRFVRPQHKKLFDQTCREVIGQGCGFKPEDAIVKKRSASNHGDGTADKKRKFDSSVKSSGERDTKTTSKCSSLQPSGSCLGTSSHLNNIVNSATPTVTSSKSESLSAKCSGDKSPPVVPFVVDSVSDTQLLDLNSPVEPSRTVTESSGQLFTVNTSLVEGHGNSPITNNSTSPSSLVDENCSGKGETADQSKGQSSCSSRDKENDGVNWETVDWMKPKPSTTLHTELLKPMTGYICCFCGEDATSPLRAPCQHICCIQCWKICITKNKKCPKCNQKVLRKHLSRIFFHSGPNK